MLTFSFLEDMSFDEIQKYNGKNVQIESFANLFFSQNKILLFLKISSLSARQSFRLRSLLGTKGISLKKIKKKDALIGVKFYVNKGFLEEEFINFSHKLFDLSLFSLVFDDFNHFLYFQNLLSDKLFKDRFFPVFVKINNQHFLIDSDNYLFLTRKLINFNYDLNLIKGSFLFSNIIYYNFFFFILYFHIQKHFFNYII